MEGVGRLFSVRSSLIHRRAWHNIIFLLVHRSPDYNTRIHPRHPTHSVSDICLSKRVLLMANLGDAGVPTPHPALRRTQRQETACGEAEKHATWDTDI